MSARPQSHRLATGAQVVTVERITPVTEIRLVVPLPDAVSLESPALADLVRGLVARQGAWDPVDVRVSIDPESRSVVVGVTCLADDAVTSLERLVDCLLDDDYRGAPDTRAAHHALVWGEALIAVIVGSGVAAQQPAAAAALARIPVHSPSSREDDLPALAATPATVGLNESVAFTLPAPSVGAAGWLAHHVAMSLLGDLGSGRLVVALREAGLAYGASVFRDGDAEAPVTRIEILGASQERGPLTAAVEEILDDFSVMGPAPEEVEAATRRAWATAVLATDAASALADALAGFVRRGLPSDWLDQCREGMLALSPAEVAAAAKTYFSPQQLEPVP